MTVWPRALTARAGQSAPWASIRAAVAFALPRGALLLAVLTFAGYAMGLVRDRMLARTFGAGPELDAYNAAFVLPELALDVLVAGGLAAAFVPVYTGLRAKGDGTDRSFGRAVLTLSAVLMGAVSIVLFILAPQTVELVAPGFRAVERDLYVRLFRIMAVTPVIFAVSIALGEILVAERHFLAYGLAPLCYNAGIVAGTVLLGERFGIVGAAVGALIGALAHLAIRLAGILRTTAFRPRPSRNLRAPGVRDFVRLTIPKMLSQPVEPLTFLYFTAVASSLDPGSVSSVSFARNFASVPVMLVGASFAIAAFPVLSKAAADGDRRSFRRTVAANVVTIGGLTVLAAVGLVLVGGLAIRVLLGGGAFDEEDSTRTSLILVVFAAAIPLEALTHLLSRALYATRNTLIPSVAAVTGFVATVAATERLLPALGVAAIPAAFTIGMAVKVVIEAAMLVPRARRIGAATKATGIEPVNRAAVRPGRDATVPASGAVTGGVLARSLTARRLAPVVALAVGAVAVWGGMLVAGGRIVATGSAQVAPVVTPWARVAVAARAAPGLPGMTSLPGLTEMEDRRARPTASGMVAAAPAPSPPPPPGPFSMDLYAKGDFVGEARDTWCLSAAVQVSMNIMDEGADRTVATQRRIFNLTRSLDPAPDGAAEPEAWAEGLGELGYGKYEVRAVSSIRAAIQLAAQRIRLSNRPAGLLVWRGAHSWVMSGFSATADPALTRQFKVTSVRIEDVWYPRFSTIWGYSRPPDARVSVAALPEDFLPWHRPQRAYPAKDGKFVIVIPVP